jgi:hypothetical protein
MAISSSHDQKNHAYLYAHVKQVSHHDKCYNHAALPTYHYSHAMFASSSTYVLVRLGKFTLVQLLCIKHVMLLLYCYAKMPK